MSVKKKSPNLAMQISISAVLSGVVSSLIFTASNSYHAGEYTANLATIPFVQKTNDETRKFAVEQDKLVTEEAHSWSNRNHDDMLLRMEKSNSELKQKIEAQAGRQELILDGLHRLEDDLRNRTRTRN